MRAIFALQVLDRIEGIFREQRGDPTLALPDVFDLIAGTGTGAIIAARLSRGKSVKEIEKLYLAFAPVTFAPAQ